MYKTCLGYVPISSSALRTLGAAYVPILLSEVEQEQRPSGNGDREAIVVGAGFCDGEGERANPAYAPHYYSQSNKRGKTKNVFDPKVSIKFDRIPFDPCNSIKRFHPVLLTRKIRPIYNHRKPRSTLLEQWHVCATRILAPRRKPIEIRCCWSPRFRLRFLQRTTFSHWDPNLPWWASKIFKRLSSILEIL